MNKYQKKQYERDQQAIKSFDILYRKSLQDNLFYKYEYEILCKIFTKYVAGNKTGSFLYLRI